MEIDDATELVIREALRRLGRQGFDPKRLQENFAEVVKERGEMIFAQLSEEARHQLRDEGLRIVEQTARLARIDKAIEYGRWLVAKYKVETLGELPQEEQAEFARLWANASCGGKSKEN